MSIKVNECEERTGLCLENQRKSLNFTENYFRLSRVLHTVRSMVTKQAVPPIKLDTGSARNTPSVPRLAMVGSHNVRGITMITLRNKEKNTACLDLPSATKVDWPANCRAIIKMPKKYRCMAGTPSFNSFGSLLNIRMKTCGKKNRNAHITRVNTIQDIAVKEMADFTLPYFFAP